MIISKRTKTCRNCLAEFLPFQSTQKVCGIACASEVGKEKTIRDNARAERKDIAKRREAMKTRSDWLKEAQQAVNAYVRERDYALPCISCGTTSGAWDAGHYLSVGARPHLRFALTNIHKQCVRCNQHLSGNAIAYRIGLIAKIGVAPVEYLESDNIPCKHTIDDLKAIKATFKAKTKALLAERAMNHEAA